MPRTPSQPVLIILLVCIVTACSTTFANPSQAAGFAVPFRPEKVVLGTKETVMTSQRLHGIVEKLKTKHEFDICRLFLKDDGVFPNNANHPLLIFQSAFCQSQAEAERAIEKANWTRPWVWGIFPYHHYHSTAWELLVCIQGRATLQLGGEKGPTTSVARGDIMLIPPGAAHKQLEANDGFTLLGSYPPNSGVVDTLTGKPSLKEKENIQNCFIPTFEPILGVDLGSLYAYHTARGALEDP
jgi:uncharacterized protein YjlB